MAYASAVMKRNNVMVNVLIGNCSIKSRASVNQGDVPEGKNAGETSYVSLNPSSKGNGQSIFASNFLVGRKPGESNVATKQVKDEWSPEATFWITLMFIVFLGILITTCCIMKQRKDENMFYGRRRARRNRRMYNDRATSTTSTKEPTDITQCSQENSNCNAISSTRGITARGKAESTVASVTPNKSLISPPEFLPKTMDIPGIGCLNGIQLEDEQKTEKCNYICNLGVTLQPNKEIQCNDGAIPAHSENYQIFAWKLQQQLQHSSLSGKGDEYKDDIHLNLKGMLEIQRETRFLETDCILQSV